MHDLDAITLSTARLADQGRLDGPAASQDLVAAGATPGPLGGDQGCTLAGDLIDSYHPSLCAVAGPNERRGVQKLAHTLVVNPGCLGDGWMAWLDWTRPAGDQVEFVDLRHLDLASEEGEKGPQASTVKVVGRHHHL